MQKNKFKSEKGSMAIYAIATILSFLIILGGLFFSSSILRKNQLRTLIKIKDVYAQQINRVDEIDTLSKHGYVSNGLVAFYDAIDNTGKGHDNNTKIWKDLSANEYDAVYKGTGNLTWNDNAYDFSTPNTNYFETEKEITLADTSRTIEIVCSLEENGVMNLIGLGNTSNSNLNDLMYNNNAVNIHIQGNSANEGIPNYAFELGKTYSTSITYDNTNNTTTYITNKHSKNGVSFYDINTSASTLNIGIGKYTTNNKNKRFKIKAVRIYNRVLTEEERSQNYRLDKARYEIPSKTAMVENTEYETLQEAINSVPTGGQQTTVLLLKDTAECVSIPENKNILLNLDGYELSNNGESVVIVSKGNVAIKGGKITSTSRNAINNYGTLEISGTTIEGTSKGYPTLYNRSGGNIKIIGGKVSSNISNTINNYGTLEISGVAKIEGTAESYPTVVNQSGCDVKILGGTISSTTSYALWNKSGGIATISGGTLSSIKSNAINNDGTLEISGTAKLIGATQLSDTGGGYPTVYNDNGGKLTVNGGTISATTSYALWNKSGATATISGGTLNSTSSITIDNQKDATITISGGRIYAISAVALYNRSGGTATVTGGTLSSTGSNAIYNGGILEINGTTKLIGATKLSNSGSNYPTLYNQSGGNIKILGGTISATTSNALCNKGGATATISGGTLSSTTKYTIDNQENATITITGGTITSTSSYAIYNQGTATVSGATISGETYGI